VKIQQVNIYQLRYPVQLPFANSTTWNRARTAAVVEATTDDGLTGWGEGTEAPSPEAASRLIGRDPFEAAAIGRQLSAAGSSMAAVSAVDIALFDLMGKAAQRPCCQLLGGAVRAAVPAYASGLFLMSSEDPTQGMTAEAAGYAEAGFAAVKMKIGHGPKTDAQRVAAVREAIGPDVLLAVDANCAYDTGTTLESVRRIAEHDIYWYEEPVPPTEVEAYREIRASCGLRIAGGEALQGLGSFRDLISKRALDIVQPDISIAGGFTECQRVEALAHAHGVQVLPHMWGTAIRLAATLHWQATIPDAPGLLPEPSLLEFDMTENALRTELAMEPIRMVDGAVPVPDGPGLGLEIDRQILERYAVQTERVSG
jgi:D-galactarolactone cycloisomerase